MRQFTVGQEKVSLYTLRFFPSDYFFWGEMEALSIILIILFVIIATVEIVISLKTSPCKCSVSQAGQASR